MLNFFKVILLLLPLGGCVGKKTDGRQGGAAANAGDSEKKEDGAKKATQPTNVGGGLDLHSIECSVSNRTDTAAQTTVVGCVFKDEKGKKFTGKITNVLASVYVNGSSTPVLGVATVLGADQTFSIAVSIPNLKPEDALSIKVGATLDGVVEEWLTSLLRDNVKATTANLDLYVDGTALNNGPLCTKELPCKQINLALSYVPSQIDHRVTIHIAEGRYDESISVIGRSITKKEGKLIFVGQDKSFNDKDGALVDLYPAKELSAGVNISGLSNPYYELEFIPAVTLENFRINRPEAVDEDALTYGIFAKGSEVLLKSIAVKGLWQKGVGASFSAQMSLEGVSIHDFTEFGLYIFQGAIVYLLDRELSLVTVARESVASIGVLANGKLFLGYDLPESHPAISVEFRGPQIVSDDQVALYVDGGTVTDLSAGTGGPRLRISVVNASVAAWIARGALTLQNSDMSITGCSFHCLWVGETGSLNFSGNDEAAPTKLNVKTTSAVAGSIFFAESGSIQISDYVDFSYCNDLSAGAPGEERYAAAAVEFGRIFTRITAEPGNFVGCMDGGLNRQVKVETFSHVLVNSVDNRRTTGDLFLN